MSFAIDAEAYIKPSDASSTAESAAQLTQVFHTHIYGGVEQFAQGSVISQARGLSAEDLSSLLKELRRLGVTDEDLESLSAAINEDGTEPKERLGPKVSAWLGQMTTKALSGAGSIAVNTATAVLPKMIAQHYGISL